MLRSDYPVDRARAAVALAEAGDPQAVDRLVSLLEDNDRGVRMYSILALERLTGQSYGYLYYAPEAERDRAVERWRNALRNGEVTLRSRSRNGTRDPQAAATAPTSKPRLGYALGNGARVSESPGAFG
jgi:hypothetical protein